MKTNEVGIQVCEHCGQELKKASQERKEIKDLQVNNINKVSTALHERQDLLDNALTERQNKLDEASAAMLAIIQRIEAKVGADAESVKDIDELRLRIKLRAEAEEEK